MSHIATLLLLKISKTSENHAKSMIRTLRQKFAMCDKIRHDFCPQLWLSRFWR